MQVSYFQLLQVSSFALHIENAIALIIIMIIIKSLLSSSFISTFTIIYSHSDFGVSSNLIGSLSQRN